MIAAPLSVAAQKSGFVGYRHKGVTIGEESVVAAGSIVTHDVPPRSVAAGNPARVIRTL